MSDYDYLDVKRAYARWKAREAWLDLAFYFAQAIGAIWLAKRLPFLRLKPWAQGRDDGTIPPIAERIEELGEPEPW